MTNTEKRVWTQPKLTILVRGKPEENVLVACKAVGQSGPSASGCILTLNPGCSTIAGS
jgi:hypothetical protein